MIRRHFRSSVRLLAFSSFIALGIGIAARAASEWPQFRGPGSMGAVADDPRLPERWSTTENVAWKTAIPGLGWSSPVVAGGKVFITTVVAEGEEAAPKKGLYFGGEKKEASPSMHHWKVYALDLKTGAIMWEKTARSAVPTHTTHLKNTYASETPVTDGGRVYAYFGNTGLHAYDFEGGLSWSRQWDPVKTRFGWGTAASPVLHDGRIYVVNDNDTKSFLTAIDAKTGADIWTVTRDERSNWATPYVWVNEKRTEIITPGTGAIRSYDLDGKPLWWLRGMSTIAIPTPFSEAGLLYVASGYVGDKLRPIYAIRPGGEGDITPVAGPGSASPFIAWSNDEAGPYNPSPILYKGTLYVLYDRGFFNAFDAKTGSPVYGEKKRIAQGVSGFTSSPWAYNGKIFCLSEDGDTFIIKAGTEYELLGKNALDEMCMATPAIVGGRLLIRTQGHLYCLGGQGAGN